jgi:hypothetical protein
MAAELGSFWPSYTLWKLTSRIVSLVSVFNQELDLSSVGTPALQRLSGYGFVRLEANLVLTQDGEYQRGSSGHSLIMATHTMNGPIPTDANVGALNMTVDVIGLGQPAKFTGQDKDWAGWFYVVRNYICMNRILTHILCPQIEEYQGSLPLADMNDDWLARAASLSYVLSMLVEVDSWNVRKETEWKCGKNCFRIMRIPQRSSRSES